MKKLIKTLTFYHDLNASCDWTEQVPIVPNCTGIRIRSTVANAIALDQNIYFVWSTLPVQPNGVLVPFLLGFPSVSETEHTFANPQTIQSIQFKIAMNGVNAFQDTVANAKLALNISFYC